MGSKHLLENDFRERGCLSDRRMDVVTDCVSIINKKGGLSHGHRIP